MRYLRPNVSMPPVARTPVKRPAMRNTIVRPISPALEDARRDRARQDLNEARRARGYTKYDQGRPAWQRGPRTVHEDLGPYAHREEQVDERRVRFAERVPHTNYED